MQVWIPPSPYVYMKKNLVTPACSFHAYSSGLLEKKLKKKNSIFTNKTSFVVSEPSRASKLLFMEEHSTLVKQKLFV